MIRTLEQSPLLDTKVYRGIAVWMPQNKLLQRDQLSGASIQGNDS
jgi:hypothetical protein